jgi:hypothetical protein
MRSAARSLISCAESDPETEDRAHPAPPQAELASPASASRFIYIVPNQCNDQHGTGSCNTEIWKAAAPIAG